MAEIKGADLLAKSLKEQGVEYHVRRGRVPGRSARRGSAKGRPALYRHAQRADRVLCRRRRRLPDRPPRLVHRRDRSGRHPRSRGPRERAVELLADAVDRRRVGDLSQRHGRLPGGAPGVGRDAGLQMGARHRAREPHPVLRRDGGPAIDLRPARCHLSRHRRRHHHRLMRHGQGDRGREMPGSAAHPDDAGVRRAGAGRAAIGRTAARHHRQGHGLLARRGRGARVHREDATAVPRLADGQGRDAGRSSAVGRRGAQPRAATGRRRVPDGRALQLDHAFRPAAALQQGRAGHPARHRAGGDAPEQAGRGRAGRRRQGDRRAAQHGAADRGSGSTRRRRRGARRSPRSRPRTRR